MRLIHIRCSLLLLHEELTWVELLLLGGGGGAIAWQAQAGTQLCDVIFVWLFAVVS